jgi:CO/xanthine dehydrogenase Mo-binding subunit
MLYSCPNLNAVQHEIQLNVGTPTPMRGPGRTPALFALEPAMDELAVKLNIDPLELRLRNYAEKDEGENMPWSSKHLREAYETGAERFGWKSRNPQVGLMRQGDEILGWGMATMTWPGYRRAAEVHVRLLADGTARATCATQDIGTGAYTVFAEVVSDRTGIPVDKVEVVLGDTALPSGPTSGGSSATASVIPAIYQATDKAIEALCKAAVKHRSFSGADPESLKLTEGRLHHAERIDERSSLPRFIDQGNEFSILSGAQPDVLLYHGTMPDAGRHQAPRNGVSRVAPSEPDSRAHSRATQSAPHQPNAAAYLRGRSTPAVPRRCVTTGFRSPPHQPRRSRETSAGKLRTEDGNCYLLSLSQQKLMEILRLESYR